MASRRNRPINLPAPYLKRIWLEPSKIANREAYPFCLPLLRDDFEMSFDRAITIIVGENGTGKSTLLEGIAVLAGYDEAGGGKGFSRLQDTWTRRRWTTLSGRLRPTSSPIPMAKAFCASSRSAASARASSFSTSRNPHYRRRARSNF